MVDSEVKIVSDELNDLHFLEAIRRFTGAEINLDEYRNPKSFIASMWSDKRFFFDYALSLSREEISSIIDMGEAAILNDAKKIMLLEEEIKKLKERVKELE